MRPLRRALALVGLLAAVAATLVILQTQRRPEMAGQRRARGPGLLAAGVA
jgi:hypothetical protein